MRPEKTKERAISIQWRFWLAQLAFWTAFWVLDVLSAIEFQRANEMDFALAEVALKSLMPTGLGFTITTAFQLLFVRMRDTDEMRFIAIVIGACLFGAMIFAIGHFELKHWFGYYETSQIQNWTKWAGYIPSRFVILICWSGIFLYLLFSEETARQRARSRELETAATLARSEMLRYQVNPHLLFNALNTVSGHVLNDDMKAADRAVQCLSDLLRISLADGDAASISLEQELSRVRLYLDVERTRFGDALKTFFIIPDDLRGIMLPPLLLQPLVENAMKHGISKSTNGGTITVSCERKGERISILIRNESPVHSHIDDCPGPSQGFGVGLRNVAERLTMYFDGDASLKITEKTEYAFAVELDFPDVDVKAAL